MTAKELIILLMSEAKPDDIVVLTAEHSESGNTLFYGPGPDEALVVSREDKDRGAGMEGLCYINIPERFLKIWEGGG